MSHYRPSEPDPAGGYCEECLKECSGIVVDQGIGEFEHGMLTGIHHEWETVSDCCGAPILDKLPEKEDEE